MLLGVPLIAVDHVVFPNEAALIRKMGGGVRWGIATWARRERLRLGKPHLRDDG